MPVLIPTKNLQNQCDPFRCNPWRHWIKLTRRDVRTAIQIQQFIDHPQEYQGSHWDDICRIAYLVVHGWQDAIQIDVGIPALRCYVDWPVLDGNHRLAAAIYRRDPTILASVSGSIPYAYEYLA